jgi:hypothetical protein
LTPWTRWPARIGAILLVVLAAILGHAGEAYLTTAARNWGTTEFWPGPYAEAMLATAALGMCGVTLGLALVALRAPAWWAIGATATGALVAVAVAAALPSARPIAVLAAALLACTLAATSAKLINFVRRQGRASPPVNG